MKALLDRLESLVKELREAATDDVEMKSGYLKGVTVTLKGTYVTAEGEEVPVDQEFEASAASWSQTRQPAMSTMDGPAWVGPKKTTNTLTWKGWEK
jgi:hypothetical protein